MTTSRLILALCALVLLALPGCTRATLDWTKLKAAGQSAQPDLLGTIDDQGAITSAADWANKRRGHIATALQTEIYGIIPEATSFTVEKRKVLGELSLSQPNVVEEFFITARPSFSGGHSVSFVMSVVVPTDAAGPVPVLLMGTFCSRPSAVPHPATTLPQGEKIGKDVPGVIKFVFGRYICTPPISDILAAGYAIAVVSPADVVPDSKDTGLAALRNLSVEHNTDGDRWGAIAAWAWTFSRMVDALEQDPRFDQNGFIAWGHSRYGKAALVAGAYDPRIDGVIAHQSGTGGASLNRRKKGESIKAINAQYPHWFAPAYATYAGREDDLTYDQHGLLALIAPRPIFLGNARRDVWSDPNGAFRAAQGATPVYALFGSEGLNQTRLDHFKPGADIAFWLRPGTHGVVKEDWPAFLAFLDAHF